ncbi:hypothetical protein LTR66_000859 [Elasticomyces elasticus]|nr:hypothetical protein LTR66_000859 [Elasticomyces elasticus]KAK5011735.1 hypothetical protein LTR28_006371 [Elasticomyces elasticus]
MLGKNELLSDVLAPGELLEVVALLMPAALSFRTADAVRLFNRTSLVTLDVMKVDLLETDKLPDVTDVPDGVSETIMLDAVELEASETDDPLTMLLSMVLDGAESEELSTDKLLNESRVSDGAPELFAVTVSDAVAVAMLGIAELLPTLLLVVLASTKAGVP